MSWKGILVGFLCGLAFVPIAAWVYLKLGYAPVATTAAPMPLEKYYARMALHAAVYRDAPAKDPIPDTQPNELAGAKLYKDNCAMCHGLRDGSRAPLAEGMFPPPPRLLKGKGVTDDPPGETFWKIRNGIRLTGMPGYQKSLSDEQMWQITSVLANADKLPAAVQQELSHP